MSPLARIILAIILATHSRSCNAGRQERVKRHHLWPVTDLWTEQSHRHAAHNSLLTTNWEAISRVEQICLICFAFVSSLFASRFKFIFLPKKRRFCPGVVKPKLTFSHGIFEIILIIFLLVALRNCWYLIKKTKTRIPNRILNAWNAPSCKLQHL